MAATYTVDASVFLSAFSPVEEAHTPSLQLLRCMCDRATPIIVPTLLLPEVSAAIARGQDDTRLAQRFADALLRLPHLILVAVDVALARSALAIAAEHRLRGSDAVYAAVALRFGSALVTLDKEQRQRLAGVVDAQWPDEALRECQQR